MANISGINDAINRVRTILDRGNTPWMSNSEIKDFISMATNEFVRERVNIFGATQKLRDDLGNYVRTATFTFDEANNSSHWSNVGLDMDSISTLTFVEENIFNEEAGVEFGYLLGIKIEQRNGTVPTPAPFVYIDPSVNYTSIFHNCKVISLDDAQAVLEDPYNKPEAGSYRAVKIGNIYFILPNLEQEFDENNNLIVDYNFHVDFVADNNDDEEINIARLPQHSREEVCLIAARKILGTTADERYPVGDNEIKELNK